MMQKLKSSRRLSVKNDSDKFRFVGELKLNRNCHGFVAVAFFFGFSRSIFVIRRFESFDVANGSILTVRHGRGRRILNDASRCSDRVCLTAEAVILQAKPQTSPRAERCSAHGFSALTYKIDPYRKFFRNRSVCFCRWINLSLGDDGSCT